MLAGVAVIRILLYICAACRAGVCNFHTAFQLRCPGVDGVRTVTVFSEQELLCLFPAALCPECGICAIVCLAAGDVHEVGDLVAHLAVQIIVTVSGRNGTPGIVRRCAVCAPLLEICPSLSAAVGNFQIETAVHIFQHEHSAFRKYGCGRRYRFRIGSRCGCRRCLSQHSDIGTCRKGLVRTQVKACVRRLVIGGLLCRDLYPVLRIVHQRGDAVVCVIGRAVDPDGLAVCCPDDQLFPPVTEDICRETGRTLGGVAGVIAVCGEQGRQLAVCAHLGDGGRRIGFAVQDLPFQVAVPVGQEVDRRSPAAERVAAAVKDVVVQSPELCPVVACPDIVRTAASRVASAVLVKDDLAVGGIYQRNAVRLILVADPQFLSLAVREKIAQVHGIAVTLVQAPQHLAVVVDTGGAGDDLLLAVAVYIGSHAVVVAVAVAGSALVVSGVECPPLDQLFVDHIIGSGGHPGVIATSGDNAGLAAVQVCHSTPEPVYPVAVAVAPFGDRATSRLIVDGVQGCAGAAVKQRVIFRSGQHIAVGIPVVLGGIADDSTLAVYSAVCGLAGHLRLSVTVEVCYEKLGIVCAGTDVFAQVDAPQPCAVQPVAVNENVPGLSLLGIVLGVGGIPLHEDLIHPVTVCIADGTVVRGIGAAAAGGRIQIQLKIVLVGDHGAVGGGDHLAAFQCVYPVFVRAFAVFVQIAGGFSGAAGVDQRVVPVQLEYGAVRIVGEKTPADQHSRAGVDGGDAPIQILYLDAPGSRCRQSRLWDNRSQHGKPHGCRRDPCRQFLLHKHSPHVSIVCILVCRNGISFLPQFGTAYIPLLYMFDCTMSMYNIDNFL